MPLAELPRWVTMKQAAEYYQISPHLVRALIAHEQLDARRIGGTKAIRIARKSLRQLGRYNVWRQAHSNEAGGIARHYIHAHADGDPVELFLMATAWGLQAPRTTVHTSRPSSPPTEQPTASRRSSSISRLHRQVTGQMESLLRVITSVKSSMVSGRQAAQAAAALPRSRSVHEVAVIRLSAGSCRHPCWCGGAGLQLYTNRSTQDLTQQKKGIPHER
jgi:hypothetical protein